MTKITVKMIKQYQKEQQEILMKYIDFKDDVIIEKQNPFDLIPKDKLGDFNADMQELEWKYICKAMGKEYSDDMDIVELSNIVKQFKQKYKLDEGTFGALIKKFL